MNKKHSVFAVPREGAILKDVCAYYLKDLLKEFAEQIMNKNENK